MVTLGIAMAGGAGALVRWLVTALFAGRSRRGTGTALVNLIGAFALGVVVGLAETGRLDRSAVLVAGSGLLGGLTTFSTWMVETVEESAVRPQGAFVRTVPVTLAGVVLVWMGMVLVGGVK